MMTSADWVPWMLKSDDGALESLAQLASGDARRALNLLETVVADTGGSGRIDHKAVERSAQRKVLVLRQVRR